MKRILVQSVELLSIGYDAELHILEAELTDGSVYQFVSVAVEVYAALIQSPNTWDYFKENIMEKFWVQKL